MNQTDKEETYTQVPNEILERLARVRLPGQEAQVLYVLWRKTWGWHKRTDKIPLSQFAKLTDIDRRKCHALLTSLERKRIVKKSVPQKGDRGILSYEFNANVHEWRLSPKKVTVKNNRTVTNKGDRVSPNTVTELSPKKATELSPKKAHSKEKKEKEKKKAKESTERYFDPARGQWVGVDDGVALGPFEGDQAPPTAAPQEDKQTYEEWLAKATGKEALNEEAKARIDDVVKRSMEFVKKL